MTKKDTPRLRALDRTDLPLLREWHNTADVRNGTFAFPFPASMEVEQIWYDKNVASAEGRNALFGIIGDPIDAKQIVGLVMLRNIDWIARSAWLGIFIGDHGARGKGHARTAMEEILSYGFETLGLHRIALEVSTSNLRAIKMYEQFGFATEGVMRGSRFVDGKFIDVRLMAVLAEERA